MPDPKQRVVLSLLPSALPHPELFRQIVWGLVPFGALEPWTRNTRLIMRDRREETFLAPLLRETPAKAVVTYTADFSPKACEEGLAADAASQRLSAKERALAMLQLAALDFAHQRYPAAIEKYGQLANVFSNLGDQALVALCLCGAGDVHKRAGQFAEARTRYVQGVETAGAATAKPVLLNCLIGLGQASYELKLYPEAEAAWDAAARVAGSLNNPYGLADAVEQVGVCRRAQGRMREARIVWDRALEFIEQHPYAYREASVLEQLVELAAQQGWGAEEARYGARLALAKQSHEGGGK